MINFKENLVEKHHLNNRIKSVCIYYGFITNFSILTMIENISNTYL